MLSGVPGHAVWPQVFTRYGSFAGLHEEGVLDLEVRTPNPNRYRNPNPNPTRKS